MNLGVRTFGFGLRAFKKFPELIPLVGIISTACIGGTSFMFYSVLTKPDVRVVKSRGPAYEDVAATESRKLIEMNKDKYKPIPELEKILKEIGSYKS